jgi:hypothetical protein
MMGRWDVINPHTPDGRAVNKDRAKYIRDLRKARSNSRRAMRSGNPAKRAEAARVNAEAPLLINQVYIQDLMEG